MNELSAQHEVSELSENEISAVGGAGLFSWIGDILDNTRIVLFGIEVSDGNPNT